MDINFANLLKAYQSPDPRDYFYLSVFGKTFAEKEAESELEDLDPIDRAPSVREVQQYKGVVMNKSIKYLAVLLIILMPIAANEKAETIEFQKKGWADGKAQLNKTWNDIKNLFNWSK